MTKSTYLMLGNQTTVKDIINLFQPFMTFEWLRPVGAENYFSSNDVIRYLERDTSHEKKLT